MYDLQADLAEAKRLTTLRYGDQYANPTPAPATPTRYTAPQITNPINEITPTESLPSPVKPILGTVDENQIREQTRQRMQSSIDAINANYANLISQEKIQGQDRSGQTRAINARSGLMGSDFGSAQQEKTTQFNKQQEKYLVDEQNARVTAVMQNIEDRASAEIQMRKQEALGQYERDMAEYEKAQTSARADLDTLAASGFDLGKLNPAQKMALFKQAGYDDQFGELIYNAKKPKPKQIDYKFEKLADGKGMFYGVDPQTGELKRVDVSVDLPPEWDMTIAPDGTVIGFDKNTGETRMMSKQGQFAKPESFSDGSLSADMALKLGLPQGTTQKEALPFIKTFNEEVNAAKNALPQVDKLLSLIKEVYNHKGLEAGTGIFRVGTAIPSTYGKEFVAKFDQLKAALSLDNIKYLKGTGAISDAEQQLLANAASSLRRNSSTSAVKEELNRLFTETAAYKEKLLEKSTATLNIANEFEQQYGGSSGTNPKATGNQVKGIKEKLQPLAQINLSAAETIQTKYPEGYNGGQCGDFARKLGKTMGVTYPTLGNSLMEKTNAIKKYGSPLSTAGIGSILVTKENPTYGHVATIIGKNVQGWIVAESNFKQSNKVSYGRVVPFNSSKLVGVINPTKV